MFDVNRSCPRHRYIGKNLSMITAVSEPVSIFTERKAALPLRMR